MSDNCSTIDQTIKAIAKICELRDPYTSSHEKRVAKLASVISQELGYSEHQQKNIYETGYIHDVGKVIVPAEILSKPSRLSEYEFGIVKTHVEAGYEIIKNIESRNTIAQTILQHHERMDGSGYPKGLSGDEIAMDARILMVADVVEAISSHRPYRPALGTNKALEEISANKGVLYDEGVVDACLNVFNKNKFKF